MHLRWLTHVAVLLTVLAVASCEAATPDATGTLGPEPGASTGGGSTPEPAEPGEGSAPAGGEAPAIAACDLVDQDEVSDAVESEVGPGDDILGSCSWAGSDEGGLYVSVVVAPLDQASCVDVHEALGASEVFDYEAGGDFSSPAFFSYNETLAETHVATWEICTDAYNVGVRVEGPEPDEEAHRAAVTRLAELVLPRVADAAGQ